MKSCRSGVLSLAIPLPEHLWHMPQRRMDVRVVASLTGRSSRTVARWRASGAIDDVACLSVLQAHAYGLLLHPVWQEWLLDADGRLGHWSGHRDLQGFRPGDLCHLGGTYREIRTLRQEIAALRRQVDAQAPADALPAANDARWQLTLPLERESPARAGLYGWK